MDLVLKFSLSPHTSKTAYFDDIVAQSLNLLQVGVLAKFIQEKADGLVMGEGFFCGDRAGVFFVGGALAAIGPALLTAIFECFWKMLVLRRKLRLAHAKMLDLTSRPLDLDVLFREQTTKALNKAFKEANKSVNQDTLRSAAPNSVAGVQLPEAAMQKYVKIIADILTAASFPSSAFDGKLVFKAAKEMKNRYLKSLNTAEPLSATVMGGNMGQGGPSSNAIDPRTDIKCLLEALQNPGQDLNAVVNRLTQGPLAKTLGENISRFRKVMQMCSAFDPEQGKEYFRKAKMVLFELPSPEEYTLESFKNYVMGVQPKPADKARDIPDQEAKDGPPEVVLSVTCSHGSETPK